MKNNSPKGARWLLIWSLNGQDSGAHYLSSVWPHPADTSTEPANNQMVGLHAVIGQRQNQRFIHPLASGRFPINQPARPSIHNHLLNGGGVFVLWVPWSDYLTIRLIEAAQSNNRSKITMNSQSQPNAPPRFLDLGSFSAQYGLENFLQHPP